MLRIFILLVLFLVSSWVDSSSTLGTPLIALKEADNCAGCHKDNRSERPLLKRRCTLDCQGCHIDPAGAGPRNQWGYYNAQAEANIVKFFDPIDPLQDVSRYDLHYDGRVIQRQTSESKRTFPMSTEFTLRVRPFVNYLHLVYQGLLLGRIGDQALSGSRDSRRYYEKYMLMIDALPLNLYVRAYRGAPMYGLRRSNHSLWIRERLGLDQFALTDAFEFGGTPTVPFFRMSMMQGDPNAKPEDKQIGSSFHGGFRGVTLGWHVNASLWKTESDKNKINMSAIGAGLKPKWFLLYGERNWRDVETLEDIDYSQIESPAPRTHPGSQIDEWTLAFSGLRGVIAGTVIETLKDEERSSLRRSYFIDLHPIPFVQFEIWRRFESGTRTLADTLAVLHLYADF